MATAMKYVTTIAKAPDSKGTFDGVVNYNPAEGDSDGERVANFVNASGTIPLSYQHAIHGDPGAIIGSAKTADMTGGLLDVAGKLDLGSLMAQAVHERMLLPDSDPLALHELSVGFAYDPAKVTTDENGVKAIHDAQLVEISVVYRGAQETKVTNVKNLDVLLADVRVGLVQYKEAVEIAATYTDPEIADALVKFALAEKEAAVADAAKDYVNLEPLAGSFEDTQEDIREALQGWAATQYPTADPGDLYVTIVATFPDRVVFGVCGADPMDYDPEYFQADYAAGADDTMTVSNAKPVDITMTVGPDTDAGKALRAEYEAWKAAAEAEKWDGAAALQSCSTAADFKKIAFERNNDSADDTAAHYALPHHQSPGADADPQGVASALGALNGGRSGSPMTDSDFKTQTVAEVRTHLENHRDAAAGKSLGTVTVDVVPVIHEPVDETGEKAGRVLSKANESKLRSAADALITAAEAIKSVLDTVVADEGKVEGKADEAVAVVEVPEVVAEPAPVAEVVEPAPVADADIRAALGMIENDPDNDLKVTVDELAAATDGEFHADPDADIKLRLGLIELEGE